MQTKQQSLIEAITNTAVGFGISFASTFLIFPLMGMRSGVASNLVITCYFTIISILRSYIIRRYFNKKKSHVFVYPNGSPFKAYCFECEIETTTKQRNGNVYCANCGLVHRSN